jgi:hypothetical protein
MTNNKFSIPNGKYQGPKEGERMGLAPNGMVNAFLGELCVFA